MRTNPTYQPRQTTLQDLINLDTLTRTSGNLNCSLSPSLTVEPIFDNWNSLTMNFPTMLQQVIFAWEPTPAGTVTSNSGVVGKRTV